MNNINLRKWDIVKYLKTEKDMVSYLQACMDEAGEDAAFIATTLSDITRACGMSQGSDRVRAKLAGLAVNEQDFQDAVTWARQSSAK